MYKIDEIESDIIVQNGVGYSHRSQIGRKVERTSPTRLVIYCYNFLQKNILMKILFIYIFFFAACASYEYVSSRC